jgi:serine/threonine-protein phosphatase 2A activator
MMTGEHSNISKLVAGLQTPVRRILTDNDMEIFKDSETKQLILSFVKELNQSVIGYQNDAECRIGLVTSAIIEMLDEVEQIFLKHPAKDLVSSRFGKVEFRDFYDETKAAAPDLARAAITKGGRQDENCSAHVEELATYLTESWGNRTRIDYGSGHELNFISFLLCIKQLGLVSNEDYRALVLRVFVKYLKLMRRIQTMYWLEPAGSHGVWGLDDYHFLPFLFGSGQLSSHRYLRPISIHDSEIVDMYADKYMYFGCIKFINTVKTASLRWHSPLIDDISGVKRWAKVNEGMIKMYDAEVLGKLPIMQHFMFGDLIPAPQGVSDPPPDGDDAPHVHNTWADCCGIPVPSAIAASELEHSHQLRRAIPFD